MTCLDTCELGLDDTASDGAFDLPSSTDVTIHQVATPTLPRNASTMAQPPRQPALSDTERPIQDVQDQAADVTLAADLADADDNSPDIVQHGSYQILGTQQDSTDSLAVEHASVSHAT